jgi:hypothetical protein
VLPDDVIAGNLGIGVVVDVIGQLGSGAAVV